MDVHCEDGRINGLDLFSGIGGLALALEPWVRPVAYCENDRFAQSVLLDRMRTGDLPVAPIWDDVRTLQTRDLPDVDIVYGGFPCQDLSAAGVGRGLAGERSGLYLEIERVIKEANPAFVFLENVPAIRTRGLGRVVWGLSELGYDCRWTVVSAAEVGAPHLRKRWFMLAHTRSKPIGNEYRWRRRSHGKGEVESGLDGSAGSLADAQSDGRFEGWAESAGLQGRFESAGGGGPVGDADRSRLEVRARQRGDAHAECSAALGANWWSVEPNVGRVANGISNRVDRLRGLGNAVVPAQAREAFMRLGGLDEYQ